MLQKLLIGWIRLANLNYYALLLILLLVALLALLVLWYFSSLFVKAIALVITLRIICAVVLEFVNLLVWPLPSSNRKSMVTAISAGSTCLYVIWHAQSTVVAGLFWVLLLLNLKTGIIGLVRIGTEGMFIPRLITSYRKQEFPDLGFPLIYLLNEPGLSPYYGQRFSLELSIALNKLKIILSPLNSTMLKGHPIELQQWVVTHAAALIVIRRPGQSSETFDQTLHQYQSLCLGSTFFLYIDPEKQKAKFVSEYFDGVELDAAFESQATLFEEMKIESAADVARTYDGLSGSAVKFIERFNSTILPISQSDAQLSGSLRGVIQDLAYEGVTPYR